MTLYQTLSIVAIVGTAGICALHYLAVGRKVPKPGIGRRSVLRYNLWERFLHLVLLVLFVVLAVTAYWASIGWGGPMTGYSLMIHTTSGAVFGVAVAAMLITWAVDNAFAKHDCRWMAKGGPWSTRDDLPADRFNAGDKIYFWAAGLLTLVLLLSMLLSMLPLFGTAGQHLMYDIHRYAALVLMVLTLWHAYVTTLAKPGGLTAILRGRVTGGWAQTYHPLWGGRSDETAEATSDTDSKETPAD